MRALLQVFVSLVFVFALNTSASAARITTEVPSMGVAKSYTFNVSSASGTNITWAVDQVTRSETSGGSESIKKNLYTATGPSATFNLSKVSGKQTIWRVHAANKTATDTKEIQVFPANKLSSFTFASTGNPVTRAYVVVPTGLTKTSKMLFVMHGQSRNADDYCGYWQGWTIDNNVLLVCPRFTDSQWPGGRGYNRGNVFANDSDTKLNPESKWAYTVVEQLQIQARNGFGIEDEYFDIWGHSAGAQFVERFLLFKPKAKVHLSMAANAGWYMMPSLAIKYECGAAHSQLSFTQQDMMDFSLRNALVFRGTKDTDPKDPETGGCMDAQGKGRFARAGYFYSGVQALNPSTTWKLIDVRNVDHDGEEMAHAAQDYLDEQSQQAGRAVSSQRLRR